MQRKTKFSTYNVIVKKIIQFLFKGTLAFHLAFLHFSTGKRISRLSAHLPCDRSSFSPGCVIVCSESAVFASPVSGRWAYQSRLLGSEGSPRGTSTPPSGLRSPSLVTHMSTPPPPPQAWVYGDTIIADPLAARAASRASVSPAVHRSVSLQLAEQVSSRVGRPVAGPERAGRRLVSE